MKKPNILLLLTDQQRWDTIAAAGHLHMTTPNLDRLLQQGCHYTHAYTPNPVCMPARHNLITGLSSRFHDYPDNNAHPLDPKIPVFPRLLAENGYDTRAIGKMHFNPVRADHGFKTLELMEELPANREDDEYAMYLKSVGLGNIQNIQGVRNILYTQPQRSIMPNEHHGTTWVGNRSVDFIDNTAGQQPFFLFSSFIQPHPPWAVPDEVADLYKDIDLPTPLVSTTPINDRAKQLIPWDVPVGREKEFFRRVSELYFASITMIDTQVGRIMDALEASGEMDNTLIIFTSDHGEMLGDYGCFHKCTPYENSARVPFLVRYPAKIATGTVNDEFVDLNDILPTVLDVAGIDYPGPYELPGGSIFGSEKDRSVQYIENSHDHLRWCSIRDMRYKYSYFYAGGREELFDLQDDPGETTNLMVTKRDAPEVQDLRNKMRKILYDYESKWGLEGYAENGEFSVEKQVELGRWEGQYPLFQDNLTDPREKAAMNSFGAEIIQSVAKEPVVRLHELDLKEWEQREDMQETLARIKREKL